MLNAPTSPWCLVLLAFAMAGCGSPPEPARDTGSRQAAADFFNAITASDWMTAFASLHPESRKNLTAAAFTTRAQVYRKKLGFEPGKVHVGICEEQGDTANAHLTISDASNSRKHRFREAIVVRKAPDRWAVILPANFGR